MAEIRRSDRMLLPCQVADLSEDYVCCKQDALAALGTIEAGSALAVSSMKHESDQFRKTLIIKGRSAILVSKCCAFCKPVLCPLKGTRAEIPMLASQFSHW